MGIIHKISKSGINRFRFLRVALIGFVAKVWLMPGLSVGSQ